MSVLGYILRHPVDAGRRFWCAFSGTEKLSDRIKEEEAKMGILRMAIMLYHTEFGRFPAKLQDLCHNNHGDPGWTGPFIHWRGESTFRDTFDFPYRYTVTDGRFELVSPGLETAKKCHAEQGDAY